MPGGKRQRHQIGDFWLWYRQGVGTWCICWLGRNKRGRAVTRRKSIAARGGSPDAPPQEALDALAAHHLASCSPRKQARNEALVEAEMAEWLKHRVADLAAPARYIYSVGRWQLFFSLERLQGRLVGGPTIADITPELLARFRDWRTQSGAGGHTISRDLAALRGALNWAWKVQRIDHPPFIPDVPAHLKAPPRSRVLTFAELGALFNACGISPEREHLRRFMVIELGTAGRPQAVLELTDANVDLVRGLIDPNQPGRLHLRKRRAIVPIAEAVRPWVTGIKGKLVRYKVPISPKNRTQDGPAFAERPTASIRTTWTRVCAEAGVADATPKTLRHTMLTWLAERGVPYEQRQMLAGHSPRGTTARNYEHLSPDYLRAAIAEVDAYFVELAKYTDALQPPA